MHWGSHMCSSQLNYSILYLLKKIPVALLLLPSPIPDIILPSGNWFWTAAWLIFWNHRNICIYREKIQGMIIRPRLMKTNEVVNFFWVSAFFIKKYFLGLNYLDNCILQMTLKKPSLTLYSSPISRHRSPTAWWTFPQMLAEHLMFAVLQ